MNIFTKLFSHFKKNETNSDGFEIVSLNSKFVMPKRSDYKDREDIQKLIDYYKKKYLEILTSKKTITSSELDLGIYYDEIKMYIELLNKLCMKEDYSDNERQLIDATKLTIYKYKILELEIRTKARLIALDEIKHSPKILFRNKNAINEEIDHLKNNTIIAVSNRVAAENEINAYKIRRNIDNIDADDKKLEEKYNEISSLANGVIENKTSEKESKSTRIAKLEVALESYAFLNTSELEKIEEEINRIENITKTSQNEEELLRAMNDIQNKYLVFFKFGDGRVTEEKIKRFFSVKLDILLCDYLNENDLVSKISQNNEDFKYYKQVFLDKITQINMGKNMIIKELFEEDSHTAESIIMKIVKTFCEGMNIDILVQNENFIAFIKSFDNISDYDKYIRFWQRYPNVKDYDYIIQGERAIRFNQYISLECAILFSHSIITDDNEKKLCRLRLKHKPIEQYFYLPEGISDIISNESEEYIGDYRFDDIYDDSYTSHEKALIKTLCSLCARKSIILPSSLEVLDYGIFDDEKNVPKRIILNNINQKIYNYDLRLFIFENNELVECNPKRYHYLSRIKTVKTN